MAKTYPGIRATINGVQYDLNRPGQTAAFGYDMKSLGRVQDAELARARAEEAKRKALAKSYRQGRDLPLAVIDALGVHADPEQRTYDEQQRIMAYLSEDLVTKAIQTTNAAKAPMTEERARIVGAAEAAGAGAAPALVQGPARQGDSGRWVREPPPAGMATPAGPDRAVSLDPTLGSTKSPFGRPLDLASDPTGLWRNYGDKAQRARPKGYSGAGSISVGGRTFGQGRYESDRAFAVRSASLQRKYGQKPQTTTAAPTPDYRPQVEAIGNAAAAGQESANQANRGRLGAAMGLWSGYGAAEAADIDQDFAVAAGREANRLMSGGMASSTVLGPMMAAYRARGSREKARIRAYARGQQAGILERASDIGPNMPLLADYANRYGRT
ncbi:MAG: hypothetical protein V2A79_14965 [Planctomycetota bacterium]